MSAPSTDVEPLAPEVRAALALAGGDLSLSDLFAMFATGLLPEPTRPEAAEVAPVTDADIERAAAMLMRAKALYGKVAPTDERELTGQELQALLRERNAIDELKNSIKAFEARKSGSLRQTVLIHMDRLAERTGQVVPEGEDATPRDASGHYLKEMKVRVPDTDQAFSWELSGGKADVDPARLLAAYEAGHITRVQYLSVTREARVYDPRKALDAIKRDPALFVALARHATVAKPQTGSLYVRKA